MFEQQRDELRDRLYPGIFKTLGSEFEKAVRGVIDAKEEALRKEVQQEAQKSKRGTGAGQDDKLGLLASEAGEIPTNLEHRSGLALPATAASDFVLPTSQNITTTRSSFKGFSRSTCSRPESRHEQRRTRRWLGS